MEPLSANPGARRVITAPTHGPGCSVWLGSLSGRVISPCSYSGPRSASTLLNDQPILSGRHPLHLYHGYLGARTLLSRAACRATTLPFAPVTQRPPFSTAAAGRPSWCWPWPADGIARRLQNRPGPVLPVDPGPPLVRGPLAATAPLGALLAALFGVLLWWSPPFRESLEAGEVDRLLGGVDAAAPGRPPDSLSPAARSGQHLRAAPGRLSRLARQSVVSAAAAAPVPRLLCPCRAPPSVALAWRPGRDLAHGRWRPTCFWLLDWVDYWWIRVPDCVETLHNVAVVELPGNLLPGRRPDRLSARHGCTGRRALALHRPETDGAHHRTGLDGSVRPWRCPASAGSPPARGWDGGLVHSRFVLRHPRRRPWTAGLVRRTAPGPRHRRRGAGRPGSAGPGLLRWCRGKCKRGSIPWSTLQPLRVGLDAAAGQPGVGTEPAHHQAGSHSLGRPPLAANRPPLDAPAALC